MPSSNDAVKATANEIERIANLEIATNMILQTLLMNAFRTLFAVVIALWVLRSEDTE